MEEGKEVIVRDESLPFKKCKICFSDKSVVTHHLTYEPENLILLCQKCHLSIHSIASLTFAQKMRLMNLALTYGHNWDNGKEKHNKSNHSKNRGRIYYLKNKEKILKRTKVWAKNNPEKRKEIEKKWLKNNKEKHAITVEKWRLNNPEKCREKTRRYYLKKKEVENGRRTHYLRPEAINCQRC